MNQSGYTSYFVAALSLVLLAGCGEEAKHDASMQAGKLADQSPIVVSVAGKPVLRANEFQKRLTQMVQGNPQLRAMGQADAIPVAMQKRLAEQYFASQAVIEQWGMQVGIEQDEEFKQLFADAIKEMKRLLIIQTFEKRLLEQVVVQESELASEYATNKERFVKAPGGVKASGAQFATPEAAQQFLMKVHGKPHELKSLAEKEKGATFRDFSLVSNHSFDVPEKVRFAIVSAKTYPAAQVVVDGKKHWVVVATEKVEPTYFAFDEIKDQVEGMVRSQKFTAAITGRMEELKKEFPIELNDAYFAQAEEKEKQAVAQA